jgi:hypothetical protein
MRKTRISVLGAGVALVTAAAALAVVFTASGVSATTAGFAADKVTQMKSRTCTGADGKSFTITNGHYTGTADFTNPASDLDGPLTIHARTVYGTSDGLGYVEGSFRVRDGATRLSGRFSGTLKGSQLVGFLTAASRGHHARVLGNLSATFAPTTGFTGGVLGSTSSTAVLGVVAGPACKGHPKPAPKPKPVRLASVSGKVSAVGDGSVGSTITVTSKGPSTATCTRDAASPSTSGFAVGSKVAMKCAYIGTTWTLRALKHR